MQRFLTLFCLGFAGSALLAPPALAEDHPYQVDCYTSSSPGANADQPRCDDVYPEELYHSDDGPWRVGFGAGYGQRSNPLINSDNIPLYGIVQLSYFGEHFYFDNGDVGAFLAQDSHWNLNLIAGVGGERSFFSFLNDSSVGFAPVDSGELVTSPSQPTIEEEPAEAPERDYVIDGGLEFLYDWRGTEIQLQLLTDISDKHNGQELWASWGRPFVYGRWAFYPSLGLTWMSARTADYYYGVRESEAQANLPAYDVGDALNAFFRLSLSYRFNAHWQLLSVLQYERLDDDIVDSPSVEDDHVATTFVGLYYEF